MLKLRNLKKYLTQRNLAILLAVSAVLYYLYVNNMLPSMATLGQSQNGGEADSDEKATIVLYYAPWCPHCKDIMPMWSGLSKKHKDDVKVDVKKVNCEEHPEQAEQNEVAAFPTIILFKNGKPYKYTGDRDVDSIESFISNPVVQS